MDSVSSDRLLAAAFTSLDTVPMTVTGFLSPSSSLATLSSDTPTLPCPASGHGAAASELGLDALLASCPPPAPSCVRPHLGPAVGDGVDDFGALRSHSAPQCAELVLLNLGHRCGDLPFRAHRSAVRGPFPRRLAWPVHAAAGGRRLAGAGPLCCWPRPAPPRLPRPAPARPDCRCCLALL